MRNANALLLALAALAGCAGIGAPTAMTMHPAFASPRTPVDVSACITQSWSKHTSAISMVPDGDGFTLSVMHPAAEADAVVTVSEKDRGSVVRYSERTSQSQSAWMRSAVNACK